MLDYARQRARETLSAARTAVLATSGPAGLQVSEVECQADGLDVYLLVPVTSDHLFNLEHDSQVSLLTADWQLKGEAEIEPEGRLHPELELLGHACARWCRLVRVEPGQVQVRRKGGWGSCETVDLR